MADRSVPTTKMFGPAAQAGSPMPQAPPPNVWQRTFAALSYPVLLQLYGQW
jgi:hypothetical protein